MSNIKRSQAEGYCKLCNSFGKIENSHIIPNFIHKWTKKTSYTGNIRTSDVPNKPDQGGYKEYMLCSKCEQLFSTWEKYFAETHFEPCINENIVNSYDIRLSKFAVSLAWRVLINFRNKKKFNKFPLSTVENINISEKIWKNYLLSKTDEFNDNIKHNIFLINENMYEHPFFNRYLRVYETTFISNEGDGSYFYIKIPYFTMLVFVENYNSKLWGDSEIKKNSIINLNQTIASSMGQLIYEGCEEVKNCINQYSDNQYNKIKFRQNNNHNIENTHAFKMMMKDYIKYQDDSLHKRNIITKE